MCLLASAVAGPCPPGAGFLLCGVSMTQYLPHQQRVVDEKAELDSKREKLIAFWETPIFHALPQPEQKLMQEQAVHMRHYSEVLSKRIAGF